MCGDQGYLKKLCICIFQDFSFFASHAISFTELMSDNGKLKDGNKV
jgi:hypothetical protein